MLGTILFLILAVIAVAAAIGMLTSTNAVHAALFLVINFVSIALFYLGLSAPFLAMVQITVYAGAIMVLFLFVIMLLGAERVPLSSRLRWQMPTAIVLVLALIGVALFVVFSPASGIGFDVMTLVGDTAPGSDPYGSPQALGEVLFSSYIFPFELTGILLLVAIIGAVILTKEKKQTPRRKKMTGSPSAD